MKKRILLILALFLLISAAGCGKASSADVIGNFEFKLPKGYAVTEVTDRTCSIFRKSDEETVGGFVLTDLSPREIRKHAPENYLRKVPGCEKGCSYSSWDGGSRNNPVRYVNQRFKDPETGKPRSYVRVFFVKEKLVYDMWFDTDRIDGSRLAHFYKIAENEIE